MKKIANEAHEEAVIRKVYADAAALDWEHIGQADRTKQYERWVEDKDVGGILGQWMSAAEVRVWLKDGPLKELARARANVGKYAKYLDAHPHSAEVIVPLALGPQWTLIANSVDEKPLRCAATNGAQATRLFWGAEDDFKHLLWAALVAWEKAPEAESHVVVFDTVAAPLLPAAKTRIERIAKRANVKLVCIRL